MSTMLARYLSLGTIALALVIAGPGCDDPCKKLAHKVCKCERTESQQQVCIQEVDASAANDDPNDDAKACCDALLDLCTCDALAEGHLATCGLVEVENAQPDDWPNEHPPAECSN